MRKYLFFTAVATVLAACSKPEAQSIPDEEIDSDKVILYQSTNGHRVVPYTYEFTVFGAIIISNTSPGVVTGTGSIKFDNAVTSIGDYAFRECYNLRSIIIPDSVTTIGKGVFYACPNLARVTLPNSLTSIGANAFAGTWLEEITLPDSLISIDRFAFYSCPLQSITFGNSIKTIGYAAFCDTFTENIVIPDSVISIGESAFSFSYELTKVVIGKNVMTIGKDAFDKCRRLTEIYCKVPIPPILGNETAFGVLNKDCKIFVPKGAVNAYKSSWNNYSEYIVGYDFNAL